MEISKIGELIYVVRGQRVMIDADLAVLYGVRTKELNKAVKRNSRRFPADFMFQLVPTESESLRFQSGTSNKGRGGRRYLPRVFSEQGVAMLSTVLQSERAVLVNIEIMRTFVRLRQVLSTHKDLADRMERVERGLGSHEAVLGKHAEQIRFVFDAIRRLMAPSARRGKRIGFLGGQLRTGSAAAKDRAAASRSPAATWAKTPR